MGFKLRMFLRSVRPVSWTQLAAALVVLAAAPSARAESHAYITGSRSSTSTYVYFQESVDGEYGHYHLLGKSGDSSSESWQGMSQTTGLGLELWKFLQIDAGYSAVSMHKASDQLDRLTGSRLHAGLRLDFNGPLFNLELGGGVEASTLNYANHEETATFYGTGNYLSVGINYFLMTHLSVYTELKRSSEHLKNTGGAGTIDAIDTTTTAGSLGFRIWF